MRKTTKYISNKKLYNAMIEHNNKINECIRKNIDKPKISNYIGECIMLICNNLSKKPNFSGYTYRQEMILDGIIDCIAAVDNFDPDKTNNPFGVILLAYRKSNISFIFLVFYSFMLYIINISYFI